MRRGWLLFALLLCAIPVAALLLRGPAAPARELPRLGEVPDFSLTTQDGKPYAFRDARGKVVVVDFIFTRCTEVCPRLTAEMRALQKRLVEAGLRDQTRLLSISVDPERDTPEALRAFAARFGADLSTWDFVTGPARTVEDAVVRGFKQAMDRVALDAGAGGLDADRVTVIHGSRFVLVDKAGTIRGFYDSARPEEIARLVEDARLLTAEGR
jgi:protein SCO1/2